MNMTEQERIRDDKLRWHCRRALLELDIVLSRLWAEQGDKPLTESEARSMERLLALEDHPLWDLVSGRSEVEGMSESDTRFLARLRML
ncbi:MAG TPA: succinate dehydrogenase assembly factor 2 [Rhodocyclaceae bacterium]|nr:succinate dehydrogenase assembly factor 2 [Rhodocyclaceae bacterium]